MSKPEVIVSYHSFGHSARNVEHLYATLFYCVDGVSKSEPLTYFLTAREAKEMNRQDKHTSYKKGDDTRRFLDLASLERRARERAAELFPDGFTLKCKEHF